MRKNNSKKKVPPNLLVIDDAFGQINWYSKFWSNLISTHRHWGMSILVATQSLSAGGHGSSTLLRNCVDMAILYHSSFTNTQKSIYISFGGGFSVLNNSWQFTPRQQRRKANIIRLCTRLGGKTLLQHTSADERH